MNEQNYGNFAEPKETFCSKRSDEVLLSTIEKCEQLEKELVDAARKIGELENKLNEAYTYINLITTLKGK